MVNEKYLAELRIEQVDFEGVLPLWRDSLWRGRKSDILATNPLCLDGAHLEDHAKLQEAFFWTCLDSYGVCGAISLLRVRHREYRVRGIIVLPNALRLGVGRTLLASAIAKANDLGAEVVWSLPRESAWPFYQRMGFRQVSDWIEGEFEFGPNCFAVYDRYPEGNVQGL